MREVKRITINDGENPLEFEITPMSALQAERWMLRAAFALGSGLSAITKQATAQEIVQSLSCVDFEKVAPLWEELLTCCQIKQGGAYLPLDPRTVEGKIDYPTTIFLLIIDSSSRGGIDFPCIRYYNCIRHKTKNKYAHLGAILT